MDNNSTNLQAHERESIAGQAALLAFDRQNHMGASKAAATNIQVALQEEAESLLSEKRVVAGAINITENKDKMKVCRLPLLGWCVAGSAVCAGGGKRSYVFCGRPCCLGLSDRRRN